MKHFKQFFVFALMTLFSVSMWGADETVTWSFKTLLATDGTQDGISWETGKTGSANATACNATNGLVLYGVTSGGGYFQTTSATSGAITNITLVTTNKKNTPTYTVYGSTDGSTWTMIEEGLGAGTESIDTDDEYTYIKVANTTAATAQLGVTSIEITYTVSGSGSSCETLAAPTNPSANPAQTSVVLNWDAVANASGYKVVFNGTDYDIASGVTTKTIEGLAMETEYHWTVAAKGDGTTYCEAGTATAQQSVTTLDACTANKAVYTVATKSSVTSSGTLEDTDATFSNTGTNNNDQMTGGKAMTLTLSGYDGATIKGLTLSMHSNGGSGAGTFSLVIGTTTVASISDATTFNKWFDNTSYGTTYRNVHVTFADDVVVGTGEDIVVTIAATTNSLYCQSFSFCYEEPVAAAVAKPTISGETPFLSSTTVTLSHADADHIYYTTNGDAPTTSSAEYTAPFSLTNTATVKAIAVKGSDVSAVAEKAFTKVVSYTTIADIYTKAVEVGSTATDIYVTFNNWIVTGVKNSNVYLTDGTNGLIIYGSGHNFEAGDILSGTAACKVQLYNGNIELTSLTASTAGLTVTKGGVAAVNVLDTDGIAALTAKNTGSVIKISGEYTSDGKIAGVKVWNNLYSFSLTVGTSYECTGVYFNGGETHGNEIMPRSADDIVVVAAATLEEVTGLAALKAKATGTSYLLNLTDAVVTLVDGNNAFIEDATAGALIYFSGHGYAAGDKLNGQYEVTTSTYQGKFEITAMEAQTGATKVADAEIPVTTMTIAQLNANFAANESKRIKIVGVNVTDAVESGDATARTGEISDGENTITLYAGKSGVTAAENANIDVIGYPTFHNTDQQLAVWAQADITVNVKKDPELAYTPASESIELGDSWSAPTLANPHSLPLSFSSDKEALATVTDAGVIALVADATGTATITASFAGDATYNAGSATYTITVSVPDTRKKATLENIAATSGSFDRTDITYAAYQGDGTTPPAANGTDLRLYKPATGKETGGYIVISAVKGCTIDEVVVTNGDSKATTIGCSTTATLATSGEAYAKNASVSFESLNSSVVYIDNIGSERMDIIKIEVYYTGEPLAIDHYFLGGTYETTFEQNGTFDYTGLKVYAAYDAGETITEEITGFVVEADLTTAGNKKAEVILNSVKIAEYNITVTAGKEDPALAYSPVSETITAGDAWSAPILSNTFNVTPITYSSDKESVATVTSEGVITLAGGYGTAVITAHFDESAAYIESEATYTITVNKPAATPTSTVYRKVTATADITDGEYLIVYEGDATHDAAVFDGSLDNVDQALKALPATIVNDEIAGNTDLDAAVFTIDATAGSLKSASGWYIGRTANSNGLDKSESEAYVNTFAITDGATVITSSAGPTLRYNYASDQLRFRYYKNNGQQAIQLYKKVTPTKEVIRGELSAGKWGTICPKQTVENVEGATFYQITYLEEQNNLPYNVVFDQIEGTTLTAGKPYFFIAEGEKIKGIKTGAELDAADPAGVNGFYGYISSTEPAESMELTTWHADYTPGANNTFVIYNNSVFRINQSGTMLKSERCYININATEPTREPSSASPVRRRIVMGVQNTNAATGMDELNTSEAPRKMIIDGKMYIFRGEKMYNANGILVK